MTCTLSPALNENQLLAFVEGEADGRIIDHVAGCVTCRQQAQQLARQQRRMAKQLYRIACPSSLELGEYQLGVLAHVAADNLAQHLQTCPHCRQEWQQMGDFLTELAPTIELGTLEKLASHVRQLVARLKPQLPTMPVGGLRPVVVGMRGNAPKQLAYAAEEIQIILDVTPDLQQPAQQQILGLLLGLSDFANLTVQLHTSLPAALPNAKSTLVASESVNELGNFIFAGIAPGHYELLLTSPTLEVRIPEIQV